MIRAALVDRRVPAAAENRGSFRPLIVFVLRHADRKPEPDDELTERGWGRAKLLARMLQESGVGLACRTEFRRARQTLQPLEEARGAALRVREIRAANTSAELHEERMVQAVRAEPADAIVVVLGHSDTVGPIVERLSGERVEPIGAGEFDRLFVLFGDPRDAMTLLRLRYGEPSG